MDGIVHLVADTASSGNPLVDWIVQAGPIGILAVVLVLFLRGDIVPRSTLTEALKQRERYEDLIIEQARLATRAVEVTAARLEVDEKLAESRQGKR